MYFYAELNDKAATVSDVSLSIDKMFAHEPVP